ncbi:MAG: hypothetical protein V5B30_14150 [Candidatus Accumulibacter delftensis]
MRTEFAFLSGLAAESLAVHRFNPYRRLARQGVATLASFLRDAATAPSACIPTRPASMRATRSSRNSASTSSSTFAAFAGAPKSGPYVSDLAVAEKVCSLLAVLGAAAFRFCHHHGEPRALHLEERCCPATANAFIRCRRRRLR